MNIINDILQWQGWNALNTISQILLSIAAFITIYLTLKQTGNGYRADLHSELIVKQEQNKKNCGVYITNIGISYVYIKHIYLVFFINNKKMRYTVHTNCSILNPGESLEGYLNDKVFMDILSENNISTKIIICIETSANKLFKTKINYDIKEIKK